MSPRCPTFPFQCPHTVFSRRTGVASEPRAGPKWDRQDFYGAAAHPQLLFARRECLVAPKGAPRVPQSPWLSFRGREVGEEWLCPELPRSPPPREEGSAGSHSNPISFSAPNFTQPGLRRRNGKGRGNANDPPSLHLP